MKDKDGPTGHIQSVRRAAAILRCFTESEPERSVTELSRRLGLHKSTISRMLSTLALEGFVEQNPATGQYRLGLGLIGLAGVALGRLDVRAAAQPYLKGLVEATGETVNVLVRDGPECVVIERANSPQPVRYMGWIGRRLPLHATASGKVLLAHMAPTERIGLIPAPLRAYTPETITSWPALTPVLAAVCRAGYATACEEQEIGISSAAAPVFDHQGAVAGTIAVTGPSYRLDGTALASVISPLLATSRQVSQDLGYMLHGPAL